MYHDWLDRWDEARAERGEQGKRPAPFEIDGGRAFDCGDGIGNMESFCQRSAKAVLDPAFYTEPEHHDYFDEHGDMLRFPSGMKTDIDANNTVWAKVTKGEPGQQALIVFHHWNATSRQGALARLMSRRGMTVAEIAMPYHFERSRPGALSADFMLSPNIGRTVQAIRQAVWDGRKLVGWLKDKGHRDIHVLGMSLGSWVAALVAAHDSSVQKASLFLTADSLADMVWTGRATRLIRESLEQEISQLDLERAWATMDLRNYAQRLVRPNLDLQLVLARRDAVVLPELSMRLLKQLHDLGGKPDVFYSNCGHYSLARPPHVVFAGWKLLRFLKTSSTNK